MSPATKIAVASNQRLVNELQNRPLIARRAYVAFLQSLFASRPAGHYHWSRNPEETEILITGQSPIKLTTPHSKPMISIIRTSASWASTGRDGMAEQNFTTADRKFTDLMRSAMVINCMSKVPAETEHIAYIAFVALRIFKTLIHRFGHIHWTSNNIVMSQVTEPGSLIQGSSDSEYRMVQLQCEFAIKEEVSIVDAEDSDFHVLLRELTMAMKAAGFDGTPDVLVQNLKA